MDDAQGAVEEAQRLGLLARLQQAGGASTAEELASQLGIAERVVVGLMSRLASHAVVEPHGYMVAGMVPFGYGPYAQQLVYYPSAAGMGGLGPYQQPPPMPAPGGQWQPHPGSSSNSSGPRRQGAGGPSPAGAMQMGPASGGGYPGGPNGPPAYAYYPGGPSAPHTPAVSGSHQRQSGMGRAGSGRSASVSSTGWGGVPLSQSAAEVLAGAVASPRTTPAVRTPSGSLELPAASSVTLGPAASPEGGEAAAPGGSSSVPAAAAAAAAARPAMPAQQAAAAEQPGEGESASQAGPRSSSSDGEEGGERQRRASSLAASSSSGGDAGKAGRNGSSSGGSSGSSRRSRGSRDRGQQPCAFFLKTGTCAYGDNCKFGHPLDKAPKVQFNSLGLPLRPGEPECAFYMRNYRCAFGHTCKFHHPELPQGASMAPAFGVPSYHMASGYPGHPGGPGPSPMMGSLLGMHGGKPGGPGVPPHGPGLMAVGSPPGPSSPHFFLPPFPPGAHPMYQGRPAAMFPAMPHGMPPPNGRRDRGSSGGGGGSSSRAAAAATPAATPSGAPLPVLVGAGPQGGSPPADRAVAEQPISQASRQGSEPSNGISVAAQAAAASPTALPASPVELGSSPAVPAPIMVFNRQQEASQKLATALEQLEIAPAAPAAPAGQRSSGGGGGGSEGVPLPPPQQQADVLAAA
ncbi:hypothetical protein COHA_006537 [Chlorella ohadii]|uniref:C3H1-type domain-containing protein n=1 Tax=Chlorella ohadii TaxID=2649997 RepID=A0AAD5H3R5_9CHLO|nr:hypothetical protein COHA_006537 [Chlorella ohadii]